MSVLTDYRSDLHNLLATVVDASSWGNRLVDESIRGGVREVDRQLVYESSFTVITAGYTHDISTITAINTVMALAFPWVDGGNFDGCLVKWRFSGYNIVYLEGVTAAIGDILRVRHSKIHAIQDLDSAVASTVK